MNDLVSLDVRAPAFPRGLWPFLDPDTWWRRAAYAAIYAELLTTEERHIISDGLYWMLPSDPDVRVMDHAFSRTMWLVRGIRVSETLSGV